MAKLSAAGKLRRELIRPFRPVLRGVNDLFGTWVNDRVLSRHKIVTRGDVAGADRVAIYLIFPSAGVEASHLHGLRWLCDNGYAPLVVSNLPLSDADLSALAPMSWQIIQRPNYGYDFGGYREGILQIRDDLPTLARLVLLNDSCWFPVTAGSTWLRDAEALGPALVGATSHHHGFDAEFQKMFGTIPWDNDPTNKDFHYTSFALSLGPPMLSDPAFLRFWTDLKLTNNKIDTTARGEHGFSRWALGQGYAHGATLDLTMLRRDIAALSDARLRQVADRLIAWDRDFYVIARGILEDGQEVSRDTLIDLIIWATATQCACYALAEYAIAERDFPFLKKLPLWINRDASDITMDIVADLPGQIGRDVLSEARRIRAARAKDLEG